jgi:hypothetical protein
MIRRRVAWALFAMASLLVAACASSSSGYGSCCEVGMTYGVIPSCVCGTMTIDGGSCSVTVIVGQSCTVSCGGQSAGGQTAGSCSDQ